MLDQPSFDAAWAADLETSVAEEVLRLEEELDSAGEALDRLGVPYDGCFDCMIRAILAVTVPAVVQGVREGRVG